MADAVYLLIPLYITAPPALGPQQPTREATDPALISKPPPSAPAEPMSYASLVKTGPPSGAAAAAGVASGNAGDASSKADGRSRGPVTKSVGEVAKSDEVKPLQQVIVIFCLCLFNMYTG